MLAIPPSLGPVGLAPLGLGLLAALAWSLGGAALPGAGRLERWLAGAILAAALSTAGLRLLGAVSALTPAAALLALFLSWLAARAVARRRRPAAAAGGAAGVPFDRVLSPETAPPLAVGAAAVALALVAAWWLPIWQWDSLGYHLPFVDLALQDHSLRAHPWDAPYIGTYPHGGELLYLGLRLLLPDDRLVDLGQLPLGLLGAAAAAAIARRLGARRGDALAAGALWLAAPAIFLQLPTDYVDVATAAYLLAAGAFLLGADRPARQLLAAVAIGLLLGTKPTAPLAAAVLWTVLAVRAGRAGAARTALGTLALLAIGGESYLRELWVHGNPVWPVAITLGPLHLPGLHDVTTLLTSAPLAPRLTGPLPWRVLRSWASLAPPVPAFDMRVGGFGPQFALAALPGALWALRRAPARAVLPLVAAALAVPDPAIARYTAALPALCLALAAAALRDLAPGLRRAALGWSALAGAVGLALAVPGLTGDGPPLLAYAGMSWAERARAVGPDRCQDRYLDLQADLRPGDVVAFDGELEMPHRLWRPDLSSRVVRLTDRVPLAELEAELARSGARFLAIGPGGGGAALVAARPGRFRLRFDCGDGGAVYAIAAGG